MGTWRGTACVSVGGIMTELSGDALYENERRVVSGK